MYTQGKLQRVHDNGRIVYAGQGDVLPDGSAAADVSAWRKRSTAEAAVKQAGQQLEAVARGEQVLVAGKRLTQQVSCGCRCC
jgi:DNA integrity scanning protein DisA with diadenylate cyclase activity